MEKARIGVTGLAVMGRNLARNLARHGHLVAVHNRTSARTKPWWRSSGTRQRPTFPPPCAHTYRRVDRDGSFHTLWGGDRTEVEP